MMFNFSQKSLKQLATLDIRLQDILNDAINYIDFSILESHRDQLRQNNLYNHGFSKLRWPNGKHNKWPSLAVDISPYPQDWSDDKKAWGRFYLLAGHIIYAAHRQGIKIRWGGDWDGDGDLKDQSFDDLGHFEIGE